MDGEIGRLLDELEARGDLDDTLIIVTADHGELFGELDLQEHQNCLHLALLQVPLFVRWPGQVPPDRRVGETVSLVDVPATILDLVDAAPARALPGHSLAPLWSGNATAPRSPAVSEVKKTLRRPVHWPASIGAMSSLLVDDLHFVVNHGDDTEELYDVRSDPEELENLVGSRAKDAERLRTALKDALSR
jgi:arylsulfatase A-like enzyme